VVLLLRGEVGREWDGLRWGGDGKGEEGRGRWEKGRGRSSPQC